MKKNQKENEKTIRNFSNTNGFQNFSSNEVASSRTTLT